MNSESDSSSVEIIIILLSIAAGATALILNAFINGLNFFYPKNKNLKISFLAPLLIWTILFLYYLIIFMSQGLNGVLDWAFLFLLFEPILYTTIMIQQVEKKKDSQN